MTRGSTTATRATTRCVRQRSLVGGAFECAFCLRKLSTKVVILVVISESSTASDCITVKNKPIKKYYKFRWWPITANHKKVSP